jgi:hypothetical protein
MAKYDRTFLVPYLQDICALYLLEDKLSNSIYQYEKKIRSYQQGKVAQEPKRPVMEDDSIGCLGVTVIGFFLVFLVGIFCLPFAGLDECPPFLLVIILICLGFTGWLSYVFVSETINAKRTNKRRMNEYYKEMREYKHFSDQLQREHKRELTLIPGLRAMVDALKMELEKVVILRERAFNANVIPRYYRNKYVAVYLYDWFSTSAADDIDHALSMFVLEEIKARLDKIIENQSEIILNQRIALANQQRESEDRRKFETQMMNKLQSMHATEEENLRYQRMIESNTAATAYFAAANYFDSL